MILRPVTFRQACAFVAEHHRHNRPPRGHKFSIGLKDGDDWIGVAMTGRPVARAFDDGVTAEINRVCVLPDRPNACSMLYGACVRAARAMGYQRILTYTQADESGASLRGAGFIRVKDIPARGSWADHSVALKDLRHAEGNGGVTRVLWLTPAPDPA